MNSRHALRASTRPVLLGWSLWLLGSWSVNLAIESGALAPTVRWTLQSALAGAMAIWPAFRLSQPRPPYPTATLLLDWASIVLVFQAMPLALHLQTRDLPPAVGWASTNLVVIDAVFIVAALAVAVFIEFGWRGGVARRVAAQAAALAAWLGLSAGGTGDSAVQIALAPVQAMWLLSEPRPFAGADAAAMTWALAAAAAVLSVTWIGLALSDRTRRRGDVI